MSGIVTAWSFDGTALANNAWRVLNFSERVPKRVGENVDIPSRYGKLLARKYFDERRVTLLMVVEGKDQSSGSATSQTDMLANMQALKKLFGKPGAHTLSRTLADTTTQTIEAEVEDVVEFDVQGPHIYKVSVTMVCASPFWEPSTGAIDDTETVTADLQTWSVDTVGTGPVVDATITIDVQAENPRITNTTTSQFIEYNGTLGAGDELVIDCMAMTAELNGATAVGDEIIHGVPDGDLPISFWFELLAGSNSLKFSADTFTAAGDIEIAWTPRYW